jgi:homoserine kinase type II
MITAMTLDKINDFITNYSLGNATEFNQLPLTTSGNISYQITTNDGYYVIRTLIRQSRAGAEDEYFIQRQLNAADINTPQYIKNKDDSIVSLLNGKPAVISKKLEGSRQADDTLNLAEDMGRTLAKIHLTLQNITIRPNQQQWFDPINTKKQLERYNGPDKNFIEQKTEEYSPILTRGLPMAITHGDFHTKNIFSHNDTVTAVFDFESAQYTVRLLDIARLYLTYRKVTNLDPSAILTAIIKGYESVIPYGLTQREYKELSNTFIYVALLSSVSIYNHGNSFSSGKYLDIAKLLIKEPVKFDK